MTIVVLVLHSKQCKILLSYPLNPTHEQDSYPTLITAQSHRCSCREGKNRKRHGYPSIFLSRTITSLLKEWLLYCQLAVGVGADCGGGALVLVGETSIGGCCWSFGASSGALYGGVGAEKKPSSFGRISVLFAGA